MTGKQLLRISLKAGIASWSFGQNSEPPIGDITCYLFGKYAGVRAKIGILFLEKHPPARPAFNLSNDILLFNIVRQKGVSSLAETIGLCIC